MGKSIFKEIDGYAGNPIRLNIHFSELEDNAPVIILAHGFKAHKDWSFIPVLAEEFAFHGFHVVRFSNSHSGVVDESGEFIEKDKFAVNSLEKEIFDFEEVIRSLKNGDLAELFNKNSNKISGIHLVGHSRGAASALISASELLDEIKLDSVVCLSPIAHFKHYTAEQFQDWQAQGFIEISDPNTDAILRMNRVYYDDMIANAERYNLQRAVEKLVNADVPTLFIRGDDDKFILQNEAEQLVSWSQGKFELEIVTGSSDEPADHNFGMPAKAETLNAPMNWAFKIALRFIKINTN